MSTRPTRASRHSARTSSSCAPSASRTSCSARQDSTRRGPATPPSSALPSRCRSSAATGARSALRPWSSSGGARCWRWSRCDRSGTGCGRARLDVAEAAILAMRTGVAERQQDNLGLATESLSVRRAELLRAPGGAPDRHRGPRGAPRRPLRARQGNGGARPRGRLVPGRSHGGRRRRSAGDVAEVQPGSEGKQTTRFLARTRWRSRRTIRASSWVCSRSCAPSQVRSCRLGFAKE